MGKRSPTLSTVIRWPGVTSLGGLLSPRALERAGIGAVGVALDIGCGTGLSSRAVREYAERVVALDASMAMLAAAETLPRVSYLAAGAEQIPLGDASVDLVTVGAAFHWFDQARVFAELARVMRTGAALVVYSDYFQGRLHERPSFTDWMRDSYLPQYPGPARHAYFDSEPARRPGSPRRSTPSRRSGCH